MGQPSYTSIDVKPRNAAKRAPTNRRPQFRPGQIKSAPRSQEGSTGGPAQTGVGVANNARGYKLRQATPSWKEFEDDFFGVAAQSTTPDASGGGAHHSHGDLKANSFRQLGDLHGGRQ